MLSINVANNPTKATKTAGNPIGIMDKYTIIIVIKILPKPLAKVPSRLIAPSVPGGTGRKEVIKKARLPHLLPISLPNVSASFAAKLAAKPIKRTSLEPTSNSIKYPLLIFFIGFSNAEEKPIKINITGKVLNHNVSGIKGAKLIIENTNGEELKSEKSGKEGKFKFKKIKLFPGEYTLKGNHKIDGYGEIKFFVDSK